MTPREKIAHARTEIVRINTELGGEYVQLSESVTHVTVAELQAQARKLSGDYVVSNLFREIKGFPPSRADAIRLGQLLAALRVPKRMDSGVTLWALNPATLGA